MSKKLPIVSICCLTYNHVQFIRNALDGFLMQEPPTGVPKNEPWYEILIHDDCSTDGTTKIIKEYAAKYPDKIFPLYEEKNQYSHGGAGKMDLYNYNRARGKYIAYCEGDDYWTDAKKLQKQVDFLETHLDYSVCWHRVLRFNMNNQTLSEDDCGGFGDEEGKNITLYDTLNTWLTQPLSMVFRFGDYDLSWVQQYRYYRDQHEIYHLLLKKKGYLFSFVGGIYVIHEKGIASGISNQKFIENAYKIDKEFYFVNRDYYSKETYKHTLDYAISNMAKNDKMKALLFIVQRFLLMKDFKIMFKQLKHLCK